MRKNIKYVFLGVLLFVPGFILATTVNYGLEMTNTRYNFNGAVNNCTNKGPGWFMVVANSRWSDVTSYGRTGYVNDTASNVSLGRVCSYDTTWPENDKGVIFDASGNCVGDVPKSELWRGICRGPKCTYVDSFNSWTSCNVTTGRQNGSNPDYSTVYGSSCTDAPSTRGCGVCNATTEATPTSVRPTNLCTFGVGTTPVLNTLGTRWVWSCNVISGVGSSDNCQAPFASYACTGTAPNGTTRIMCDKDNIDLTSNVAWAQAAGNTCTNARKCEYTIPAPGACGTRDGKIYDSAVTAWPSSDTLCSSGTASPSSVSFPMQGSSVSWNCSGVSCSASRKLNAPSVDLRINGSNGPINPNLDNGDNLDISWTVTSNASGVTTYCSKSGNSWGSGQIIPSRLLIDADNNIPLPTGSYPINNSPYSLTCFNGNGNNALNSASVTDTVLVNVYCNPSDTWSSCDSECDGGNEYCTRKNNRCESSSCGSRTCNDRPCPVTSEWKEVRP